MVSSNGPGSRRLAPLRLILFMLAALGGFVVLVAAFTFYQLDYVAGLFGDRMLAQARAPNDGELPPTAYAISYSADDVQPVGGQGEELSCSVPDWLTNRAFRQKKYASISLRMRQACVFHDYCYRHGAATYGYNQADCDYLLLEHAYRICRFINTETTVENCVRDARKVLLGVRAKGADNFRRADRIGPSMADPSQQKCEEERKALSRDRLFDDACTSSYFEFNPYPTRTPSYTVYRIAESPERWIRQGLLRKAVYAFEMRPAGTLLTIIGFKPDDPKRYCVRYNLPADFHFLNTAPLVVRAGTGETGEEWLVWWRRKRLEATGGHLAILAPRRATLKDWGRLFPGAIPMNQEEKCSDPSIQNQPGARALLSASSVPASKRILITDDPKVGEADLQKAVQEKKNWFEWKDDDAQFSELHPAPGFDSEFGIIRLMALRAHDCTGMLCYHEMRLDPSKSFLKLEPYKVRDRINWNLAGSDPRNAKDDSDPDLYRNYPTPPIVIAGPGFGKGENGPVLAWLRRGEARDRGETYTTTALMRRAHRNGERGLGLAVVQLLKFTEGADPVFVLGRTTGNPRLGSIQLRKEKVEMYQWDLASAAARSKAVGQNCGSKKKDERVSLADCAEVVVDRAPLGQGCADELDRTWLVRPPLVLASKGDSASHMIFTRFVLEEPSSGHGGGKSGQRTVSLQAISAELAVSGPGCTLSRKLVTQEIGRLPEGPNAGKSHKDALNEENQNQAVRDWENAVSDQIKGLRARPVLAVDMGEHGRYLVMPDAKNPGKTLLWPAS